MFELIDTKKVDLLNLNANLYQHSKFKTKHLHLESENSEKVFMVAFKTVPEDSTGIAHILEHTALCGSKRYPVRDPFFMMLRRSINTFMNAFTSSDWTAYPFATQNSKDFENLLKVYTDAAFFPNLDELDFFQEGHRLEFNENNELEIKGVVFNEMKGAMSAPSSQLWHGMTKHLFPETTYQFNSGGEPKDILNLTHNDLVNFHQSHYHPTNASFYSFGDMNVKELQEYLEENVMSKFDPLESALSVPLAKKFESPKYFFEYYQPTEDKKDSNHVVVSWLLGKSYDSFNLLEKYFLSSLLIDNSSSPLRHALETTDLGSSISPIMGLEPSNKELVFAVGLEGVLPDKAKDIEKLVMDSLESALCGGIYQSKIDAALHQLEISQREISGGTMPYGLQLILGAMGGCIHDEDPISLLDINKNIELLKENVNSSDYIDTLIRDCLIDNKHRLLFELKADPEFNDKENKYYKDYLAQKNEELDESSKKEIIELSSRLNNRQNQVDDESILPKIEKKDIPDSRSFPEISSLNEKKFYKAGTNGIIYHDYIFSLEDLNEEEIGIASLYAYLLTNVGLNDKGYDEIQEYQSLITGNISASIKPDINHLTGEQKLSLIISAKSLEKNASKMRDLIIESINHARFDETKRIQELIQYSIARNEEAINSNGHGLAMDYAAGGISSFAALNASMFGIKKLQGIKSIINEYGIEKGCNEVVEILRNIHEKVKRNPSNILTVLSDANALSESLATDSSSQNTQTKVPIFKNETAWIIPAQVNYCAETFKGVNFLHDDAPKLSLLGAALRNGYLHTAIREKGGAYGAGAMHDASSGVFKFFSYRDPNCGETFHEFQSSINWVKHNLKKKHLDEAVLNVISSVDKPLSPVGEAKSDFYQNLNGINHEMRLDYRNKILNTRLQDLHEVAEKYLTTKSFKSVIGSKDFESDFKSLSLHQKELS